MSALQRVRVWSITFLAAACGPSLDTTRGVVPRGETLGAILYTEVCQRLAHLAEKEEGRWPLDVSGETYRDTCYRGTPPPAGAPLKLRALHRQRQRIIDALDRLLPDPIHTPTREMLRSLGPLYDDGTLDGLADDAAALLDALMVDAEFASALASLQVRDGYRPPAASPGLSSVVTGYPALGSVLDRLLDLVGSGKPARPALDALLGALDVEARALTVPADPADPERSLRLLRELAFSSTVDNADGVVRLITARDWRGLATFSQGVPPPLRDQDGDGLADVDAYGRFVDAAGMPVTLPSPFVRPGVVDTSPRDAQGRALDAAGTPLYRSVELDGSLLAALVRELAGLADPVRDPLLGLVYGAGALLGPRVDRSKPYDLPDGATETLRYRGFGTDSAALLDLAHASIQLLGAPDIEQLLTFAKTLLGPEEDTTARALAALLDANERGKAHPQASIPRASNLFDDLVPIVVRMLRVPGLLEELAGALSDPHVRGLGAMLAYQADYRDAFVLDQNQPNAPSSVSVVGDWRGRVDRSQPDLDSDRARYNRSILQRMLHLIHDANNVEFCNKQGAQPVIGGIPLPVVYGRCEAFRVDDLALFYVLGMADPAYIQSTRTTRYETTYARASFREALQDPALRLLLPDAVATDTTLELLTGIDGFGRFPAPRASNRALFLDPAHQTSFTNSLLDPVRCRDGDRFIDVHNDSIFAWERAIPQNPSGFAADTFYDAVRPLITAFARHDECLQTDAGGSCIRAQNAAKIFVDLVSVLHEHWGSARSSYFGLGYQRDKPLLPRYALPDQVVTYEPLLAELLGQSDLFLALVAFAGRLPSLTVDGTPAGPRALPVLQRTAAYLFDAASSPLGLAYRDGRTEAVKSDGTTLAGPVTPYYLLADAFAANRTQLDAAPADQQGAWRSARSALVDRFLGVAVENGRHQLANRRIRGVGLVLLDFLGGRLRAHTIRGDRTVWVREQLTADLTDVLDGPLTAALVDLSGFLDADPATRSAAYGLLGHVAAADNMERRTRVIIALGDVLQALLDDASSVPLAHGLGLALAPARGTAQALLDLADRARALDPSCPPQGSECVLVSLLRNVLVPAPDFVTPAGDLSDAVLEVHRVAPGAGTFLLPADYREALAQTRRFLVDQDSGLVRFIRLVKQRRLPGRAGGTP